jgi:lipoprotein signal peptidase
MRQQKATAGAMGNIIDRAYREYFLSLHGYNGKKVTMAEMV